MVVWLTVIGTIATVVIAVTAVNAWRLERTGRLTKKDNEQPTGDITPLGIYKSKAEPTKEGRIQKDLDDFTDEI